MNITGSFYYCIEGVKNNPKMKSCEKHVGKMLGRIQQYCTPDSVVSTSKFQITKPDALFVVFLGIKWAYDF